MNNKFGFNVALEQMKARAKIDGKKTECWQHS